MKRILLALLVVLPLISGCKEEETPDQEAFIFGQWNLLCQGNCIQIYKFEGGKLFEDNMRSFREAPVITYKTSPMDSKYWTKGQALENSFPKDYLMPKGLQFIGCPNCVEEGGYYLAFERESEIIWWQVGRTPELWPEEIRPFMEKMIQTFRELPAQQ
jgi:hypothetical protein